MSGRFFVPVFLALLAGAILFYALNLSNHGAAAGAPSLLPLADASHAPQRPLPHVLSANWQRSYKKMPGGGQGSLDAIRVGTGAEETVVGHDALVSISRRDTYSIRGWAIDVPRALAGGVFIQLGSLPPSVAHYGIARPDVAIAFSDPSLADSGYEASFRAASLKPGIYPVHILILDSSRDGYDVLPDTPTRLRIAITP
jgi:hypothetical protein